MSSRTGEIWLLWHGDAGAGVDAHVIWLADVLRVQGLAARIICLGRPTPMLRNLAAEQAVAVLSIEARPTALLRAIAGARPRLLHTHGTCAGALGRTLGWILGVPVVSTPRRGPRTRHRAGLCQLLDHLSLALPHEQILLREPSDACPPTPNGARLVSRFLPLAERPAVLPRTIAYVVGPGRNDRPELFFQLAEMVPPMDLALYFTMKQTVPPAGWHRAMNVRASLGREHVRRCPNIRCVDGLGAALPWREIGLLCVTAADDIGLERALQAMAHGIPVVAFGEEPLRYLIADGDNGWLVKSGNLAEMARRISKWQAMDEASRRVLSDGARRTVAKHYSPQTAVPVVLDAYASVGARR